MVQFTDLDVFITSHNDTLSPQILLYIIRVVQGPESMTIRVQS
jgi:hypothetical protein